MKFLTVLSALCASALAIASPLSRQFCPDALRFGNLDVTPTDLYPGANYTVNIDFTCAIELGYPPKYVDFYINTLNNNGYQPSVLISRHEFVLPNTTNTDANLTFPAQIPEYGGFYAFPNSSYVVEAQVSYGEGTIDNQTVYLVGSPGTIGINITISD